MEHLDWREVPKGSNTWNKLYFSPNDLNIKINKGNQEECGGEDL